MPFERARTLLALGRVRRRLKQKRLARTRSRRLCLLSTSSARPLWAERTREELGRVTTRKAPETLTATEREIAALAADGLTNQAIAEQVFVSQKTVEANLARAYRKLGISSRAQLVAGARGATAHPFRRVFPPFAACRPLLASTAWSTPRSGASSPSASGPDVTRSRPRRARSPHRAGDRQPCTETCRYLGSILLREDEVVLCQFEGTAETVRDVAERAQIPFERLSRRSTRARGLRAARPNPWCARKRELTVATHADPRGVPRR